MNTPYHCGFFLKLWDQLLGGLYPTEVPVQCTVYIMHYFNLYSYSTEMIAHCCTIFLKSSGYRNIAQGGDPIYAGVD